MQVNLQTSRTRITERTLILIDIAFYLYRKILEFLYMILEIYLRPCPGETVQNLNRVGALSRGFLPHVIRPPAHLWRLGFSTSMGSITRSPGTLAAGRPANECFRAPARQASGQRNTPAQLVSVQLIGTIRRYLFTSSRRDSIPLWPRFGGALSGSRRSCHFLVVATHLHTLCYQH